MTITVPRKKVKVPRLQLRWVPQGGNWNCMYELVLPLAKHDIRRPGSVPKGHKLNELVVPMGNTERSGGVPCQFAANAPLHYDAPVRDGAHAQWDAEALGDLPVYVVAPDGTFLQDDR